jgi:predicted TIM-barrel fold metal-dependent hydrolase
VFDFTSLPVVDHHCHPYQFAPSPGRYRPLDTFLGEPGDSAAALVHREGMIYQQWAPRLLAEFLGCEPDGVAEAATRARQTDEIGYVNRLFEDARIKALIVDTGYPQPPIELSAFRAKTPAPVVPIFRIEPLIRALLGARLPYEEAMRRYSERLRRAVQAEGYVGLKTTIANQTGLAIDPGQRDENSGRRGFDLAVANPNDLQATKPIRDHLVLRTIDLAMELDVPLAFHTGIGDASIVLNQCNPALLYDLLKQTAYRRARFVLMHCYPFVAEASWLAAALPNVGIDLSLGVPFAPVAADRIFAAALELAPYNRILYGSDAYSGPEQIWLGAKLAKAALARVFTDLCQRELVTELQAYEFAAAILDGNARALYRLGS